MEDLYVYSGKCQMGKCGDATKLISTYNEPLFVGDIVITTSTDDFGICSIHGLTVIVSNQYTSYSNGTVVKNKDNIKHFPMGIKEVDFMAEDSKWCVKKVKSYEDVIDGENWKDYGFNFKIKV